MSKHLTPHLPFLVCRVSAVCNLPVGSQIRGNIRVFESTPLLRRIFFYHSQLAGMLSPSLVALISAIRCRGGEVRLWKCGRFVMPSDLGEVFS